MSVGGDKRRDGHLESLFMCPFHFLFTDESRTGWGVHLEDLTAAGIWTEEEPNLHFIGDCSSTGSEHFQGLDHGRVRSHFERQW